MHSKIFTNKYSYNLVVKSLLLVMVLLLLFCSCNKKSKDASIDTIRENIKINEDLTKKVISELKEEKIGAVSWNIDYSGEKKLIFHNNKYLIAYTDSQDVNGIYQILNLDKIDSGYMQGDIFTCIDISPDGNYAIINNANSEPNYKEKASSMYFYDIVNDNLEVISKENHAILNVAWSRNSLYYAIAYDDGSKIKLYDVFKGEMQQSSIDIGRIKEIYVDDDGNILVGSDSVSKYLLHKGKNFAYEQIGISGEIIGFYNKTIAYIKDNSIYTVSNGEEYELKTISEDYKYAYNKNGIAVFCDSVSTYIYDINTSNEYQFEGCAVNNNAVFSPNAKQLLLTDNEGCKIVSSDGTIKQILDTEKGAFSTNYYWMDNETLVRITQKNGSYYYGDFAIVLINANTGEEKSVYSFE